MLIQIEQNKPNVIHKDNYSQVINTGPRTYGYSFWERDGEHRLYELRKGPGLVSAQCHKGLKANPRSSTSLS